MSDNEPTRLEWKRETTASIEDTWALFSDTDRFNRAAGFLFSFDETPRPDGTVHRVGHWRALGLIPVRWEERPFRYRVPEWFESVRLFEGGPAERLVLRLRLEDLGGSTAIHYSVEVTPRSAFMRPIVALELSLITRPKLDRIIEVLLRRLNGEDVSYDTLPPPLTTTAEESLLRLVPRIPPPIGDRLAGFIREAPLHEQVQIHPLRLAESWAVTEDRVLDGVLTAVKEGLLELRWDLLCPDCRGPKAQVRSLSDLPESVHCPSCNIVYDGTFPDSLVVTLTPASALRDIDLPVVCIGSPARQPHVITQDEIPVSGSQLLQVELVPGAYRVRTHPHREAAGLLVYDDAPSEPITLKISSTIQPARVVAPPGIVTLTIDNYSNSPVEVLLERRARPNGILTVGRLLERPAAQALLPKEALMPGMDLLTRHGAVLAVECLDAEVLSGAVESVKSSSPRVLTVSPRGLIATWDRFSDALAVASHLSTDSSMHIALNAGSVTEATLGSRVLPMGSTIEETLGALAGAADGHAAIPVSRAEAPEVREALGLRSQMVRVDFPLSTGVRVHWIKFG